SVAAFNVLASSIEIPVRFEREVALPAVGPEGGVTIAAAAVPLRLAVVDVEAFRGKLWVSIDGAAGTAAASARPWGPAAFAEPAPPPVVDAAGDAQARAALRVRLQEIVA